MTTNKKIYPNDPCPCGSGKKYKKCCMDKKPEQKGMIGNLPCDEIYEKADFFVNRRGAVVFMDESKQPVLKILEGSVTKHVLSVGFSKNQKAMVTIQEDQGPICYIIPDDYIEWCTTCVGFSINGVNLFPADVVFSKKGDKYFVDIL